MFNKFPEPNFQYVPYMTGQRKSIPFAKDSLFFGARGSINDFYNEEYNNYSERFYSVPDAETVGRVLNFNGVNAYIECFTASKPDHFTFTCSFTYNSTGTNQTLFSSDLNSINGSLQLRTSSSDQLQIVHSNISNMGVLPVVLLDGSQYQVVFSFNTENGDWNIFLVGIEEISGNYASYASIVFGLYGIGKQATGNFLNYKLYDADIIHDRTLTTAEKADIPTALDNICANEPEKIYRLYLDGADPTSDTIKPQGTLSSTPATLYNFDLPNDYSQTELLTANSDFSDSAWVNLDGILVESNSTTAPDGTISADKLIPTTGDSFLEIYQIAQNREGKRFNQVYYVKSAGLQYLQIIGPFPDFGDYYVNFDLINGSVTYAVEGNTIGLRYSISPIGNGFYRIFVSAIGQRDSSDGRFAINFIKTANTGRGVNEGDFNGTDGVYVWNASLQEQGTVRPSPAPKHGFNVANNLFKNSSFDLWTTDNPDYWIPAATEDGNNYVTETEEGYCRIVSDGSSNAGIAQAVLKVGITYDFLIDIKSINGTLVVSNGVAQVFGSFTTSGIKNIQITPLVNSFLQIKRVGVCDASISRVSVKKSGTEETYYPTTTRAYDNVVIHADLANPGFDLNGVAIVYKKNQGILNDSDNYGALTKFRYADNALLKTADTDNVRYDSSGNQLDVSIDDMYYEGYVNTGLTWFKDISKYLTHRLIKNDTAYKTAKTGDDLDRCLSFFNDVYLRDENGLILLDEDGNGLLK